MALWLLLLLACWLSSQHAAGNYTTKISIPVSTLPPSHLKAEFIDDIDGDGGTGTAGLHAGVHLPVLPMPKLVQHGVSDGSNQSYPSYPSLDGVVELDVHIYAGDDNDEVVMMVKLSAKRFAGKCHRKAAASGDKHRYPIAYFNKIDVKVVDSATAIHTKEDAFGHNNETVAHAEQYHHISLDSSSQSIAIIATTYHGVLNAFATLAQLFSSPLPLLMPVRIADWPESAWRGLLVDVSRHFQPLALLKRLVDGMEHSKMNVLHLHLSDSQSFPVLLNDTAELPLSQLALHSAFSRDKVYTLADLEELVDYAYSRGVEVVPEIDVPAHVRSWGAAPAFKGIVVNCSHTANAAQTPINIYLINPINPTAIRVIKEVIQQISAVFKTSRYFHIGGDEVNFNCWREDESVVAHLRSSNTTVEQLLRDFEGEVFSFVRSKGKVPVVWQDSFDSHTLPVVDAATTTLRAVVQPWKCWSGLAVRSAKAAAEAGFRVVMSACWYLDYEEDWTSYLAASALSLARASVPSIGASRSSRGARELIEHSDTADESAHHSSGVNPGNRCLTADSPVHSDYFLGGEGSMWTENVDHSNLECRMWPRAGAVAAKLWGYSAQHPQQRRLGVAGTRSLLLAVAVYRTFLCDKLRIKAADLAFHSPLSRGTTATKSSRNETVLVSKTINDISAAARYIRENVKCAMAIPSSNDIAGHLSKCVRLTSSCLGIPEKVQRPYRLDRLKIGQLNVADGSTGGRDSHMLKWLQSKADEGVMLIGLCELNGWQEMESTTNIMKNFPRIRFRAANAGFSHSHIMVNSQPYNIGLVSVLPFEVKGEYGPPHFQRGLLHVYYPDLSLHVLTAHLHAHDSAIREKESLFIVRLARSISNMAGAGTRVVLMGDLNTLSPLDAVQHTEEGLLGTLQRKDHAVFARLGKKFLDGDRAAINYRPMQLLLEGGFRDVCVDMCRQSGVNVSAASWTLTGGDVYSRCMQRQCPFTEPTKYNPEWPQLSDDLKHPRIRLDYILSFGVGIDRGRGDIANAFVDITEESERFSDHFPVFVEFVQNVTLF